MDLFIYNIIEKQKEDILIKNDNILFQITSTFNQKNNEYYNISSLNLGECKEKLRMNNNISNGTALLVLKVDIYEKGILIPIIEYEIYNSKTKEKLDLSICNNIKVHINIPVNIDENNLFKYNPNHEYYNDLCFSYTTKNKADIIIKDRRDEYINNNMSLCENNCTYNRYDLEKKKVLCECFIKIKFPFINEIIINKDKLMNNFKDITRLINLNVIKCYKKYLLKME